VSERRRLVTVTEAIWVARPRETVFDFTQDYARRPDWDAGITAATVLRDEPRAVRVSIRGLGDATVEYRLFRRPERTSAAFVDVDSPWIMGGGGSWDYRPVDGGTMWEQTNSFELKRPALLGFLAPFFERSLCRAMRRAMAEAKRTMESA
jgi:hypothetical protein